MTTNVFYDELSQSLSQALEIAKGDAKPSRKFSHDVPNIKMVREKTGLSQQQFSEKLNISPRTLQNWEQATRNSADSAVTLMRLLDKNPELIMDA